MHPYKATPSNSNNSLEPLDLQDRWFCRADVGCTGEAAAASLAGRARLSGLLHAGGILNDALLARQTPEHVRKVFAPKAYGAWNLAQVCFLYAATSSHHIVLTAKLAFEVIGYRCGTVLDAMHAVLYMQCI